MPETIHEIQISGLRMYWLRLKKKEDSVLLASFREHLGNPSNGTFYGWLDKPGSMKASVFIKALQFLKVHFPEITQETLLKNF